MDPLIVLNLGKGNCVTGLPIVTARISLEGAQMPVQYAGSLPPAPQLPELYQRWRALYKALHDNPFGLRGLAENSIELKSEESLVQFSDISSVDIENELESNKDQLLDTTIIEFDLDVPTNISRAEFRQLCQQLRDEINKWFNSSGFRSIDQQFRTKLGAEESIRIVIETDDPLLQKLPWHLWNFFEHYSNAGIALSSQEYRRINKRDSSAHKSSHMRILVVLGHNDGINNQPDRIILEDTDAETVVLNEPPRSELDKYLWDKRGWDIFFFSSYTSGNSRQADDPFLNTNERLSIDQLKHALTALMELGLKLAIFNSSDGLGLAQELAALNLPQLIVMREPLANRVAQTFLQNFLRVFADGESFYTAVRHAREQLQGIEGKFPCASWQPVIFQNPTELPITWPKKSDSLEFQDTFETQWESNFFGILKRKSSNSLYSRRRETIQFFTEALDEKLILEMVKIPTGKFVMGSPKEESQRRWSEGPQHDVTINQFFIGQYPVTQAQWRFVTELPQIERILESSPSHFKGDSLPVEQVSWYEAIEFCKRLSVFTGREYGLPTEAQWEYACRAGTTTPFHFGEAITTEIANYGISSDVARLSGEYREKTMPVTHFGIANAFGMCDMHGNVWEWCQDHWNKNYENAPTDGSAWLTNEENTDRVVRGGSWMNPQKHCRSASRFKFTPHYRYSRVGFRLVYCSPMTPTT